jgi:hypothetical protein
MNILYRHGEKGSIPKVKNIGVIRGLQQARKVGICRDLEYRG